jgi:hypothetical protein
MTKLRIQQGHMPLRFVQRPLGLVIYGTGQFRLCAVHMQGAMKMLANRRSGNFAFRNNRFRLPPIRHGLNEPSVTRGDAKWR